MLTEREIFEAWEEGKGDRQFRRLTSERAVAFEYRGPQVGHPSNYAAIKMLATPADKFSLASVASYPASVSPPYAKKLLLAVGRAVADELFAADWYPYRGCQLVVQEVGWDEVMSSEVAIYRAARGALSELRREGQWTFST